MVVCRSTPRNWCRPADQQDRCSCSMDPRGTGRASTAPTGHAGRCRARSFREVAAQAPTSAAACHRRPTRGSVPSRITCSQYHPLAPDAQPERERTSRCRVSSPAGPMNAGLPISNPFRPLIGPHAPPSRCALRRRCAFVLRPSYFVLRPWEPDGTTAPPQPRRCAPVEKLSHKWAASIRQPAAPR